MYFTPVAAKWGTEDQWGGPENITSALWFFHLMSLPELTLDTGQGLPFLRTNLAFESRNMLKHLVTGAPGNAQLEAQF